jgi:hypothetical protein
VKRAPNPTGSQLKDYMAHGGVVINWEVFGSGNLQVCGGLRQPTPPCSFWQRPPRAPSSFQLTLQQAAARSLRSDWLSLQLHPKGNAMMSYSRCSPRNHSENRHVKSVVRPACTLESSTDPHHFFYRDSPECVPVSTRHEPVPGPKSKAPVLERWALYHYAVKSVDDFQQKMLRGSGMGNIKTLAFLQYVDNFTTATCVDALDLGLQLNNLMLLQSVL